MFYIGTPHTGAVESCTCLQGGTTECFILGHHTLGLWSLVLALGGTTPECFILGHHTLGLGIDGQTDWTDSNLDNGGDDDQDSRHFF